MTEKYTLLIYMVHSFFEMNRNHLIVDDNTTVENFRDIETNRQKCLEIESLISNNFRYDISWNQLANGIKLFLVAREKSQQN